MRRPVVRSLSRFRPRDRDELFLLVGGVCIVLLLLVVMKLAGEVAEGETLKFDRSILLALRDPHNPSVPIGPGWMVSAALDITALGSATVLGLTVVAVAGFLILQGMWRTGVFVAMASGGALFVNAALKQFFQRPRPDVVPHLREVMTMSFPSGHALTSAVVYLTLGALSMRIAERRLTKFYCMAMAMLVTVLVGVSRVVSRRPLPHRRARGLVDWPVLGASLLDGRTMARTPSRVEAGARTGRILTLA